MENRTLFLAFLVAWAVYLLVAHSWAHRRQLPLVGVIASHVVPSAVAIVMTYVFLIARGATVAQFVAGSESGMDLWSLWFHLWPVLLVSTALSVVAGFIWTVVACVKKAQRRWVPIAVGSTALSTVAFFTVAANFPDA